MINLDRYLTTQSEKGLEEFEVEMRSSFCGHRVNLQTVLQDGRLVSGLPGCRLLQLLFIVLVGFSAAAGRRAARTGGVVVRNDLATMEDEFQVIESAESMGRGDIGDDDPSNNPAEDGRGVESEGHSGHKEAQDGHSSHSRAAARGWERDLLWPVCCNVISPQRMDGERLLMRQGARGGGGSREVIGPQQRFFPIEGLAKPLRDGMISEEDGRD
jgi:hypothetical protein